MKELKAKIDEFDATKNKLTEMIQQKETLQCQWTDVNQVQNNFLEFSQIVRIESQNPVTQLVFVSLLGYELFVHYRSIWDVSTTF